MNKSKALAKNTIILGVGQFVPKIIAIIILPILTKSFSTEEFGIYDLIISFSSLALPLMTLLIQQAVFRFLIEEKDVEKSKVYVTNSVAFIMILSILWFLITGIACIKINIDFKLLLFILFLYFSESIYDLFGQVARGKGENLVFTIAIIIYSIVNMILLLIFMFWNIINIINVVFIIFISYIIATMYLYIRLRINESFDIKKISFSKIKELLKYSIPIIPSSIALWIVNLSDRVIITSFLGASLNGIYAAASKIPNLFGTAYNVFNLAWTELAARSIHEKNSSEYYSKLINNLYSFMIGTVIIIITFSPLIFNILIDEKFNSGYFQMPILILGVFISCFVSFYGGLYIALKKTKQVGISSLVGAILNIIINILFIKNIGLYAASISTLLSFVVILIYRVIEIKKYIIINYNYKNLIVGVIFLVLTIINFYINNTIVFVINILITLIYNIVFNNFLKYVISYVIDKIKVKKQTE